MLIYKNYMRLRFSVRNHRLIVHIEISNISFSFFEYCYPKLLEVIWIL